MHHMTCFKINYQRSLLGVIIIININKILISGTLISYTTKLSNNCVAIFSKSQIWILDVKVLFITVVGKLFGLVSLHMAMWLLFFFFFNYYERTQDIMEMKKLEIISWKSGSGDSFGILNESLFPFTWEFPVQFSLAWMNILILGNALGCQSDISNNYNFNGSY